LYLNTHIISLSPIRTCHGYALIFWLVSYLNNLTLKLHFKKNLANPIILKYYKYIIYKKNLANPNILKYYKYIIFNFFMDLVQILSKYNCYKP